MRKHRPPASGRQVKRPALEQFLNLQNRGLDPFLSCELDLDIAARGPIPRGKQDRVERGKIESQ